MSRPPGLTLQLSHAHSKKGRGFERGGDEKKRTNGERWLWRLVRRLHAGSKCTDHRRCFSVTREAILLLFTAPAGKGGNCSPRPREASAARRELTPPGRCQRLLLFRALALLAR